MNKKTLYRKGMDYANEISRLVAGGCQDTDRLNKINNLARGYFKQWFLKSPLPWYVYPSAYSWREVEKIRANAINETKLNSVQEK